jgi:hypothetical protein
MTDKGEEKAGTGGKRRALSVLDMQKRREPKHLEESHSVLVLGL